MKTATKCEHNNTEITLEDQIRCKDCGTILESVEKQVGTANSAKAARSLQEEIAVTGRYIATTFENGFVVFSKTRNNIKEEVICRKTGNRFYHIIKRLSMI